MPKQQINELKFYLLIKFKSLSKFSAGKKNVIVNFWNIYTALKKNDKLSN